MKKIILVLIALNLLSNVTAQAVDDSVSIGASYANQVWYSLSDGEQLSAPKTEWDLAFAVSGQGANILINSAIGTKLWVYPNSDISGWSSLDTSGITTWPLLYNSDTTWSLGAFNKNKSSDPYDLGWGIYDPITHFVNGDSLFVIKLSDNSYRKLWIEKLASGTYTFRYANLDGANEIPATLIKSNYSGKNFAYYSIQNNAPLDREPLSSDWDLVFTQYTAFIPNAYGVTGVLSNNGVTIAEARPVDVLTASHGDYTFSAQINTIGYDWKTYGGGWTIEDSTAYFVKDVTGNIWKMVFTGFGGSADGKFYFTKEMVSGVGINEINVDNNSLKIYPNPLTGSDLNITYHVEQAFSLVQLTISDEMGRTIHTTSYENQHGLQQIELKNLKLSPGLHIISLTIDGNLTHKKLIVK